MNKYLLCVLLVSVWVGGCKNNKNQDFQQFDVTVEQGYFITSQVGETILLTASVSVEGEYQYEWLLGSHVISENEQAGITLEQEGLVLLDLKVTSKVSKESKYRQVEVLSAKNSDNLVVGYLPEYKDNEAEGLVQWDKITHLCYAFAIVNSDGSLDVSRIKNKLKRVVTDGHEKGVYVLVSLGGGGTHNFSDALLDDQARYKLVQNTVACISEYKLDGVDVDFEEWDGGADGASPQDREKRVVLEAFYKELKEALPADKLLAVAVSSSWENPYYGYYDCYTKSMHQYWDFAGIMIYDQTGTWETSPYGQHASMEHFDLSIDHWLNNMGLPKEKLIAGVPFYGYEFKSTNGGSADAIAYKDIISRYPQENVSEKDHVGHIFYNGRPTIRDKCEYVKTNKLGGIMIWELAQDSNNQEESLLEVISQSIFE